ncbi:transmembrane adaptor Erv26-domain-containing protein [Jimgerdemannia flammicorona]|uniref:Transmembrane adaptor Erv26-domain-containing protein n=1 Tax=Jimgerdemannia flammicorona TaxID=994334 RepID=A0A433D081_9FUNG|nr:transmembrane adaptor Erv26-domain-containing protein [Jimgerdemannia flammicorona]
MARVAELGKCERGWAIRRRLEIALQNMSFLHFVAYAGAVLAFVFVTLSLACGLYYLAELVEEYTVLTKKIIKYSTAVVVTTHFLLWIVDGYPFTRIAFSLLCHGVYSMNLQTFPFISLSSPPFLASCALVLVDHFVWFQYFTRHYAPFGDIAAFFGICVWLVPFAYFISLSANDNALPLSDPNAADMIPAQHKQGLFKAIFAFAFMPLKKDEMLPSSGIGTQGGYQGGGIYNGTPLKERKSR